MTTLCLRLCCLWMFETPSGSSSFARQRVRRCPLKSSARASASSCAFRRKRFGVPLIAVAAGAAASIRNTGPSVPRLMTTPCAYRCGRRRAFRRRTDRCCFADRVSPSARAGESTSAWRRLTWMWSIWISQPASRPMRKALEKPKAAPVLETHEECGIVRRARRLSSPHWLLRRQSERPAPDSPGRAAARLPAGAPGRVDASLSPR